MALHSRKKVLVLRNDLAFNAGVQSLLSAEKYMLDVIGHKYRDQDDLFQTIERIQPNVIIMDDSFLSLNLAALLMFLQSYPNVRTVIMSLKESQVQVYDTKQIPIGEIGDFLAVVYFPGSE